MLSLQKIKTNSHVCICKTKTTVYHFIDRESCVPCYNMVGYEVYLNGRLRINLKNRAES